MCQYVTTQTDPSEGLSGVNFVENNARKQTWTQMSEGGVDTAATPGASTALSHTYKIYGVEITTCKYTLQWHILRQISRR